MDKSFEHYDYDSGLFESFLDPYLKYGSGLYMTSDDTFEQSAVNMLDEIISISNLSDDSRILDIGNGWGCLTKRLFERFPKCHYLGINPSKVQIEYIEKKISLKGHDFKMINSVLENINLCNLTFDAIVMLETYCHLDNRKEQLKKLSKHLSPTGSIIIEDVFFLSDSLFQNHANNFSTKFVQDDVFGNFKISSLADFFNLVSDSGLKVVSISEHSSDYKKTIKQWIVNLNKREIQDKYPLAKKISKCMEMSHKGLNYTTAHYLAKLKPKSNW